MRTAAALVLVIGICFGIVSGNVVTVTCCKFDDLANAIRGAADGDVIQVANGTYNFNATGTVTLPVSVSGLASLSIMGQGASGAVLANLRGGFLSAGNIGQLTLAGLSLRGGINSVAVNVSGVGALNITNCTFSTHSAARANLTATGILATKTNVSISGSSFSGFVATLGTVTGVVAVQGGGSLAIDTSTFSNVTARGSVIVTSAGVLSVTGTSFSRSSSVNGTTLAANASVTAMTISGSTFTSCTGYIAGVFSVSSNANYALLSSTFSNNLGTNGPGVGWIGGGACGSLTGVTVRNNTGRGAAGYPGGIYLTPSAGSLSVATSTFGNNNGTNGGGLAVRQGAGCLTVASSIFTGNSALSGGLGGGIYAYTSVTVTGSTFTGNVAVAGDGGAIWTYASPMVVTDTVFTINRATVVGGAVYSQGGTFQNVTLTSNTGSSSSGIEIASGYSNSSSITNCTFSMNSGSQVSVQSAAVPDTTLFIGGCQFRNNNGGYSVLLNTNAATATIVDSQFFGNAGSYSIYVSTALLVVERCQFNANGVSGVIYGSSSRVAIADSSFTQHILTSGIVYNAQIVNMTNSSVTANSASCGVLGYTTNVVNLVNSTFTQNSGSYAGLVYQPTNMLMDGCIFSNNYGLNGVGIVYEANGLVVVRQSQFIQNTGRFAGALSSISGVVNISSSVFLGNTVTQGSGALSFASTATVTDCIFLNNSAASSYDGGAISASSSRLQVFRSTFTNNVASYGGAISASGAFVSNCTFLSNTAASSSQGGGAMYSSGFLTITGCAFYNNRATEGGAVYASGLQMRGSTFVGNSANIYSSGQGGALYLYSSSACMIDSCSFVGNFANSYGGAIQFYISSTSALVTNSSFIANSADTGGAIYNAAGVFANVTAVRNRAQNGAVFELTSSYGLTVQGGSYRQNNATNSGGVFYGTSTSVPAAICCGSEFVENWAVNGGVGSYYSMNSALNVFDATFVRNSATTGGAFAIQQSFNTATFRRTNFTSNTGANVILADYYLTLVVDASVFANNSVSQAVLFTLNSNYPSQVSNSSFSGGVQAIRAYSVVLSKSNFTASSVVGCGGAIFATFAAVVDGSIFVGTSAASHGGAIYAATTVSVTGSTFISTSSGGKGGALYSGSNLISVGSTFTGTLAAQSGGAGYSTSMAGVVTSSITGSTSMGDGGAFFAQSSLTSTSSTFTSCSAQNGGAILVTGYLTVTGSVFDRNTATTNGGAVSGIVNAISSVFTACSAANGGALSGSGYVSNGTFMSCRAVGGGAMNGNGFSIQSSRFTLNSAATSGGAVVDLGGGSAQSTIFEANTAGANGGAYAGTSGFTANSVTFRNNRAAGGFGGAIYTGLAGAYLTSTNCTGDGAQYGGCVAGGYASSFTNVIITSTTAGLGGAMYLPSAQSTTINGATIIECTAGDGGGIWISSTGLGLSSWSRLTIQQTVAKAGYGGGIHLVGPQMALTVRDSTITSCQASLDGAGIYAQNVTFSLINVTLSHNGAVGSGGGIGAVYSRFDLNNSLLTANLADAGAGMSVAYGGYRLNGNTSIVCNVAATGADGVACINSNASAAPTSQIAGGLGGGSGVLVTCQGCTGACVGCAPGCTGGCSQAGAGCYDTESPCTSCQNGFSGRFCTAVNRTRCVANFGCPLGVVNSTCNISCAVNTSIPNPAIDLSSLPTIKCSGGVWPYQNACLACPPHTSGPNCSIVAPTGCPALTGAGISSGCAPSYVGDYCTPRCDLAGHYLRNTDILFPLTCQPDGTWSDTNVCPRLPFDCDPLPVNDTSGVGVGCIGGFNGDLCTPACADNFTMDPAYAFALPLTCGAVGGWTPGPDLCVPCTPGRYGSNCTRRFENFCPMLPLSTGDSVAVVGDCTGRVDETCQTGCVGATANTSLLAVTCLASGSWSARPQCFACAPRCASCVVPGPSGDCTACIGGTYPKPTCSFDVVCSTYAPPPGVAATCSQPGVTYNYSQPCALTCLYDPTPLEIIHCVNLLQWSTPSITCPQTAPPPPSVAPSPPPPLTPPPPPPAVAEPPSAPPVVPPTTAGVATAGAIVSPPPSGSSSGTIIGAVAGVAGALILLLVLVVIFQRRRSPKGPIDDNTTMRVEDGARRRIERMLKGAPVIGKGLTAVVYRAALEDGTPVAIKVSSGTTESAMSEFHREAHFLGLLIGSAHKNITCMRFFSDNPRAIVMDLADGGSVRGLLKNGRPAEALDIVRQTAAGLQCLHDNGIGHLDIKPENILCATGGVYKITDFGTAVSCESKDSFASGGAFVGTPAYCSPERFLVGVVDPKAADVYSFALTIWSVYEAASPFIGETFDTLSQKSTNDMEFPLRQLTMDPNTPEGIVQAVLMGIQRDMKARAPIATLRRVLEEHVSEEQLYGSVASANSSTGLNNSGKRIDMSSVSLTITHTNPLISMTAPSEVSATDSGQFATSKAGSFAMDSTQNPTFG